MLLHLYLTMCQIYWVHYDYLALCQKYWVHCDHWVVLKLLSTSWPILTLYQSSWAHYDYTWQCARINEYIVTAPGMVAELVGTLWLPLALCQNYWVHCNCTLPELVSTLWLTLAVCQKQWVLYDSTLEWPRGSWVWFGTLKGRQMVECKVRRSHSVPLLFALALPPLVNHGWLLPCHR